MKTHSGEKPNKCNQCEYSSVEASKLRIHLKRHSGEKTSKCNQRQYPCVEAGDLRKHVIAHNNEAKKLKLYEDAAQDE